MSTKKPSHSRNSGKSNCNARHRIWSFPILPSIHAFSEHSRLSGRVSNGSNLLDEHPRHHGVRKDSRLRQRRENRPPKQVHRHRKPISVHPITIQRDLHLGKCLAAAATRAREYHPRRLPKHQPSSCCLLPGSYKPNDKQYQLPPPHCSANLAQRTCRPKDPLRLFNHLFHRRRAPISTHLMAVTLWRLRRRDRRLAGG